MVLGLWCWAYGFGLWFWTYGVGCMVLYQPWNWCKLSESSFIQKNMNAKHLNLLYIYIFWIDLFSCLQASLLQRYVLFGDVAMLHCFLLFRYVCLILFLGSSWKRETLLVPSPTLIAKLYSGVLFIFTCLCVCFLFFCFCCITSLSWEFLIIVSLLKVV